MEDEILSKIMDMVDGGYTQAEIARRLGISESTVNRWVNRKHKISKAYTELIKIKLGV